VRIVDAQVHIWSGGTPSGRHRQVASFTAEELLAEMDAAGVDAAVIHPPVSWDPGSNDLAVEAARRWPDRFAVLGQCRSTGRRKARRGSSLARAAGHEGLRYPLVLPEQQDLARGRHHGLAVARGGAPGPAGRHHGVALPAGVPSVAERHPELRLVIDHLGLVRSAQDDAAFANLGELLSLAALPNVAVKATGAPGYSTAPYPFRNIHDGLRASSTPSGRGASSGAPTSPACRAATASA
jgi:predicted TIM-barrel fold metal-dependent hydrolase